MCFQRAARERDMNTVPGPEGFGAQLAALRRRPQVHEGAYGEVFGEPLIGDMAAGPSGRVRPVRAGPVTEVSAGDAELCDARAYGDVARDASPGPRTAAGGAARKQPIHHVVLRGDDVRNGGAPQGEHRLADDAGRLDHIQRLADPQGNHLCPAGGLHARGAR